MPDEELPPKLEPRPLPNEDDGRRPEPKLGLDVELPSLPLGEKVLRGVEVVAPLRALPKLPPPTVLRVLLSRPPLPKVVPLLRCADGRRPVPNEPLLVALPRLALPKEPLLPRLPNDVPPPLFIIGWRLAVPNCVRLLGLPWNPLP